MSGNAKFRLLLASIVVALLVVTSPVISWAAVEGVGGGGIMGWNTSESYKEVFRSCMKNRGHTVLN